MPSFLVGSSSFLQETKTCIKAWMCLNFGHSPPPIDYGVSCSWASKIQMYNVMITLAPTFFYLIFFILVGNQDIHKTLDAFEFSPDRTTDYWVSCPWAFERNIVSRGFFFHFIFIKIFLLLADNQNMHNILSVLIWPDHCFKFTFKHHKIWYLKISGGRSLAIRLLVVYALILTRSTLGFLPVIPCKFAAELWPLIYDWLVFLCILGLLTYSMRSAEVGLNSDSLTLLVCFQNIFKQ